MKRSIRYILTALCALSLVVLTSSFALDNASAMAKIKCKLTTGTGVIDPIVHHNEKIGTGHLHQFFGNNAWLPKGNAAGYNDLMGKQTNCENTTDTAGYWVPALLDSSGRVITPVAFTAYYRSFDHADFGAGQPFAPDTRLVGANMDTKYNNWTCGQFSSVGPQSTIPHCSGTSPGTRLTAHVTFPSCWDGKLNNHTVTGDTQDTSHFAYAKKTSSGYSCPAGFPTKTVELRETIGYNFTGTGARLSSDMPGMAPGTSLHGDFWNTWVQSGLTSMVKNCVTSSGGFTSAECG
jgi:Domain of unknown function (DUF1996)